MDQLDADVHDWLIAIQATEAEVEAEERKKAEKQAKAGAMRPPRRR